MRRIAGFAAVGANAKGDPRAPPPRPILAAASRPPAAYAGEHGTSLASTAVSIATTHGHMAGVVREHVQSTVVQYRQLHDATVASRRQRYTELVNQYYDLVTDFYEFGWGTSFHFAPRRRGESLLHAIVRHEQFLAAELGLREGMQVADLGCGVGGPMREIARFSGCNVVGINNNAYQIERGWKHTRDMQQTAQCSLLKADFMHLPHRDEFFDAAYTIEASCHAPNRVALFREIARVMKPGAYFGGYEWCLTEKFDPQCDQHLVVKKNIEAGNGLPDIAFSWQIDEWLQEAGLEIITTRDLAPTSDVPWYIALTGADRTLRSFPRTPLGRRITNHATALLELLHVAPKGTREVSDFLNAGADALVAGGQQELFTPLYFFHVRKPLRH